MGRFFYKLKPVTGFKATTYLLKINRSLDNIGIFVLVKPIFALFY